MPEAIFAQIPFKETHEALKAEDEEALKNLLCGFVVSMAKNMWVSTWDSLTDKKEKKLHLKALVYLDALISLYRMPPQFEFDKDQLSQRFRGVKESALE